MENYSIDGHADLARDPATGAIVNVNSIDYTYSKTSTFSFGNKKLNKLLEESTVYTYCN